jgi:outer membrane protein assembly factor BamE (lipoprotein component of BamABCDE complex)
MHSTNTLLIYSLLVVATIGCKKYESQDVDQNDIKQNYVLTYDKNRDITTATAEFRTGKNFSNRIILNAGA